jgi:hypothetical protein
MLAIPFASPFASPFPQCSGRKNTADRPADHSFSPDCIQFVISAYFFIDRMGDAVNRFGGCQIK